MTHEPAETPEPWPLGIPLSAGTEAATIWLRPGLNVLVGPNGTGKTRALRAIKANLAGVNRLAALGRKIRYLAAGRSAPFESYRSSMEGPHHHNSEDAAVGNVVFREQWWQVESLTGDLMALDARADLKLKVQARLQQLFDRSLTLTWSQNGLVPRFSSSNSDLIYSANQEASGILQLVALLAAIHNDEIGALIIDEPEISLHPQHQAFLLEEMEQVAGDPADPTKKMIVFATHSASFLPLRNTNDLPRFSFFSSGGGRPAQVGTDEEILRNRKLSSLLARLNATHRMAMFAEHVLLVEGTSDEIVATQLAQRLGNRLLARNAQIVPVNGKGEFVQVARLFDMMGKRVAVVADLDALADDNGLVNLFSRMPAHAAAVAARHGLGSVVDLDRTLRQALTVLMQKHAADVEESAGDWRDWSDDATREVRLVRLTLARLLAAPETFPEAARVDAVALSRRYDALLGALAALGCFFLKSGAIENYYGRVPGTGEAKPDLAAEEAATFAGLETDTLRDRYAELIAALRFIAPDHGVDEDRVLQPKLGAALTAAFLGMAIETSDEALNRLAIETIGGDAAIFSLANVSRDGRRRIRVSLKSTLFKRPGFPFEIGENESIIAAVERQLPGLAG